MLKVLETKQQFNEFIGSKEGPSPKFVHFCADWVESCGQLNELLIEFQKEYGNVFEAAKIDAEGVPEISLEYKISAVPTVAIFQGQKLTAKVEGFHPSELKDLIVKSSFDAISSNGTFETDAKSGSTAEQKAIEPLNERLKRLINTARLTLFMKGSPDTPRCGFSRQIVDLFRKNNVDFWSFDILNDETVRQGLKTFSDWPTYPQVYLDGELLGGLDVIREEMEDAAFVEKLPKKS